MLEVTDLAVRYGGVHAVRGVSIRVAIGEAVAVLGANGAGKSSTLAALSGLVRPKAGSVIFCAENITAERPHRIVRRGLVHVPEGRRVFASMSVEENLLLGGHTVADRADVRSRVAYVFDLLPRLAERKTQAAGTLSGGEQQLLAVGRALIADPRMMMLDEPTMGLAPQAVGSLMDVLHTLKAQGTSILLVEQNAHAALQLADRGYVLEHGSVVVHGTAAELAGNAAVVEAYLGSTSEEAGPSRDRPRSVLPADAE